MERTDLVGYRFGGGYFADLKRRYVLRDHVPLDQPLFPKEFDVLLLFLESPRTPISRTAVKEVFGGVPNSRALDDYVSKIKKKLQNGGLFRPVRNVGYELDANVEPLTTADLERASELFKAAEMHFNLHTVESMRHGLRQALDVLAMNPGLAEANTTVAYSYINLSQPAYAAAIPDSVIPQARQAAAQALSLSPKNARAQGILGLISLIYDHDWKTAEELLRRALSFDSGEVGSLLAYAHLAVSSGRSQEAFELIDKAVRSDPTDQIVYASWGRIYLLGGETGKAIERGHKAIELYPQLPPARGLLGLSYEAVGDYDNALKYYLESLDPEVTAIGLASLGHLYGKTGDEKSARSIVDKIRGYAADRTFAYLPSYCLALVHMGLRDHQKCLEELKNAVEQKCDWLIHLAVEPRWEPIRSNEEFKKIARMINLPNSMLSGKGKKTDQ